ncbi:MAG: hypothetical protein K2X99_11845 [Gemmatimonadaceae bacterium]|nr:hypothetical protein [Gemmatimonadaceae bacterium]
MPFTRTLLDPAAVRALAPGVVGGADLWLHRYHEPTRGWTLSVATHAAPGSGKLSLGGFRIAPEERTALADFSADREALGLAVGMEGKVYWSRLAGIGGPLARRDLARIVGGKCVMHPTASARVGAPDDTALLDFAIDCFRDIEAQSKVYLTTGQDLGHGTLSDGTTSSLAYLNARYKGSVVADTSLPTAEGNYQVLIGMLRALGIAPAHATVGLIGAGNVGGRVAERLLDAGATVLIVESRAATRGQFEARGVRCWDTTGKAALLAEPIDALVVNAAGSTLDAATVAACAANPRLQVVCGSENLTMPDPAGVEQLRAAHTLFAPTEFAGMMGYLTAAEEYLAYLEGTAFDAAAMLAAAAPLEEVAARAAAHVVARDHAVTFADAVRATA